MTPQKDIPELLTVVVPVHLLFPELAQVRASLQRATSPCEVLLVVPEPLKHSIGQLLPRERLIASSKKGRGQMLAEGVRQARGTIIVFVHADTILPDHWDHAILGSLRDEDVIGGGFSLTMDTTNGFLRLLIKLSDLLFLITGELWGDRALFVRASFVTQHLKEFEIPMMEDVRLTLLMQKVGKVVLLKQKVVTSARTFRAYGLLFNAVRVLLVRLWYGVGRDPQKIYDYYYRQ